MFEALEYPPAPILVFGVVGDPVEIEQRLDRLWTLEVVGIGGLPGGGRITKLSVSIV